MCSSVEPACFALRVTRELPWPMVFQESLKHSDRWEQNLPRVLGEYFFENLESGIVARL